MITGTICIIVVLAIILIFVSILQLLYLESLRLRTREYRSLEYFKDKLQGQIGVKPDEGSFAFSLVKHTCLTLVGIAFVLAVDRSWEGLVGACILAVVVMLVTTYLVPQILYRRSAVRWLSPLAPFAKALALAARPCMWLLNFIYSVSEFGSPEPTQQEPENVAEHIEALISAGQEEGIIEEQDRRLIQSVVAFGDKTVREVMTPRPNIVAVEAGKSLDDLRQLVLR